MLEQAASHPPWSRIDSLLLTEMLGCYRWRVNLVKRLYGKNSGPHGVRQETWNQEESDPASNGCGNHLCNERVSNRS